MDTREVLTKLREQEITVEEAELYFRRQPFEDLGYAKLDTHRKVRSGFPEVIFCAGKEDRHRNKIPDPEGSPLLPGLRVSSDSHQQ